MASRSLGADEAVVAKKWWKHHGAKGGTPGGGSKDSKLCDMEAVDNLKGEDRS
jgi:hypothetical protein